MARSATHHISQIAQRIEVLLDTAPEERARLRTELQVIRQIFADRPAAQELSSSITTTNDLDLAPAGAVAAAARDVLDGKRIALVGFDHGAAERLAATVESTGAFSRSLDGSALWSASDQCRHYDLLVIRLKSELGAETTHAIQNQPKPVLLVGSAGSIGVDSGLGNQVDFALWPVRAEELLMRAHRLLSAPRTAMPLGSDDKRSIMIADDDPTVNALIEHTLKSYEFDCHTAESGYRGAGAGTEDPAGRGDPRCEHAWHERVRGTVPAQERQADAVGTRSSRHGAQARSRRSAWIFTRRRRLRDEAVQSDRAGGATQADPERVAIIGCWVVSYQPGKRARVAIWLQALAAAAVLCGATVALEFVLPDFLAESYPLRLALAFGLVQLVAITIVVLSCS